jgi:hypothetical protein
MFRAGRQFGLGLPMLGSHDVRMARSGARLAPLEADHEGQGGFAWFITPYIEAAHSAQ